MSYLQEQVREWVYNHGVTSPQSQWLSTPMDTWEINPHYHGPDQPHPESIEWDEEDRTVMTADEREDRLDDLNSDIPF